jgi:hypothetical protein
MCWAYKIMKHLLQAFFCFCVTAAGAQNTSSPYSILGIGDIENDDYGRYSASGGAAVARRENGYYNFSNPASLTIMNYKSINLDFGLRGRTARFKVPGADTLSATTKDFIVKRVTLAFKLTPTVAIAAGLKPFSSVNYQYSAIASIADGNAQYLRYTDGSGGIYQTYFSAAKELRKRFSAGITASWLFGSLQNSTSYYNPGIGLDIVKNENKFYYGAALTAGLQYYTAAEKKWQHTAGITATAHTHLKGETTVDYTESSSIIKTLEPENIRFKLPVAITAGYSLKHRGGLSLNLQGNYQKWPVQKLNYSKSLVQDAFGFNAGMEYSKKFKGTAVENYFIGWGVKMEESYLLINSQKLQTLAATVGGGKSISRVISVNGGLEFGKRGNAGIAQIQENYFQFSLGITFKDIWFGTKRFGRFN